MLWECDINGRQERGKEEAMEVGHGKQVENEKFEPEPISVHESMCLI